jgi:hypothetical protein
VKLVSEVELHRALTLSDLFAGMTGAIFAGAALGAWLWWFLGLGVGG